MQIVQYFLCPRILSAPCRIIPHTHIHSTCTVQSINPLTLTQFFTGTRPSTDTKTDDIFLKNSAYKRITDSLQSEYYSFYSYKYTSFKVFIGFSVHTKTLLRAKQRTSCKTVEPYNNTGTHSTWRRWNTFRSARRKPWVSSGSLHHLEAHTSQHYYAGATQNSLILRDCDNVVGKALSKNFLCAAAHFLF